MKRRNFIGKSLATGALLTPISGAGFDQLTKQTGRHQSLANEEEIYIERLAEGKPHAGKVLAVIQPHSDDIPLFAAGTVAKLLHEGYTGYLIRTTNDDSAGIGNSLGEVVMNNEKDNDAVAKVLGLKKVYNLNYRNHNMDEYGIQEIKARMIFLIRLLKIDTVICYDPWAPYENNPDHYITARAVEASITPAAARDYPEQLEVVDPHLVVEKYFFTRRGPQQVNRIVDISQFIDKKVEANMVNITQGPAGNRGSLLKKRLAAQGKRLPVLGDDDRTADFNYIKHFVLDLDSATMRLCPSDRAVGEHYGLEWAERFHYIGRTPSILDEYVERHAIPV